MELALDLDDWESVSVEKTDEEVEEGDDDGGDPYERCVLARSG